MKEHPLRHQLDNHFLSPAKVNLFFRVLRKRSDGYHEIATKMQAISLFDSIYIKESEFDKFTCSDPLLPIDASNLVLRARDLFRTMSGVRSFFSIHLEKKIPSQAGLGGGSGNAATTLYALNKLCGQPLSLERLQKESVKLGADVPFFFSYGTAYCTGIGERIEELPFEEGFCFIIKPKWGVGTQGVYANCIPNIYSEKDPRDFLKNLEAINELEHPVFQAYPSLKVMKEELQSCGFQQVVMTGSGSSFLCYGDIKKPIESEVDIFPVFHIQRKSDQWYA